MTMTKTQTESTLTTTLEEKMFNEALHRLEILQNEYNLHPNVLKDFKSERKLNCSENEGILFWLDNEIKDIVSNFEKEYNAIVYHVIKSFTIYGIHYSLLYVSKHQEEWEMDIEDLKGCSPCVYVYNADNPACSEFGCIGIKPKNGGIIREY